MTLTGRLERLLAEKNHGDGFSGVVLLQRGEEELFNQAYGYAIRSWKIENRIDTRFRIASISKMFTAVAILQLIEGGNLSLDTGVVDCLGLENTTIPKTVTVYHLLTMTSGIADWFDESGDWEANWAALCREYPIYLFRRNQDYLPLFVNHEQVARVGEGYKYNGAGYILLGLIIENVAGMPYFDYVREHAFVKARMNHSDFLALDGVYDEVAEGYMPITDTQENVVDWKKNVYSTTPEAAADGGATSTAGDLIRFSQALRQGSLLSIPMTEGILTPKVQQNDQRFRGHTWMYGYGNMFILDDADQIVRYGHTGEEDGASCRLYYYLEQNLDVVILANQSWAAGDLAWEIHDLIFLTNPRSRDENA